MNGKHDDANGNSFSAVAEGNGSVPSSPQARWKVYTKTGDGGESSLYTMERRRKDDQVFEALGDVDELNSVIGVSRHFCSQAGREEICSQLEEIQSRLLDVGTAVATPTSSASKMKRERAKFPDGEVEKLERWIDEMDESLAPLRNFILPSGGCAASFLHMARTICRRAERRIVALAREDEVEVKVMMYLNRLSDYLFTAARIAAMKEGMPEVTYKKSS